MSSPTPIIVPPPRRRSLAGPIILIVIGLIFLLKNLGVPVPVFELFAKYWPLLLVLAGLVKIAEHYAAQRSGSPEPRLGGGVVFLLVLLVLMGASASGVYHNRNKINWGEVREEVQMDDDFMHLFGSTYTFDGELQQPIGNATTLKINGDRGNVTVTNWDQPNVKVVWHKRLFASNENESRQVDASTNPQVNVEGSVLNVNVNTQGAGPKGVANDVEIFAPNKLTLDVSSRRGDVSLTSRMGDIRLDLGRGDATLDDITGNLQANVRRGSLRATKVNGNVNIDGRLDDVVLSDVTGGAVLRGDFFGDVRLSKIAKGVKFNSSRTDMEIAKIDGDLDLDTGNLRATQVAGPVTVTTRAKDIQFSGITGDLRVNNDAGDITVEAAHNAPLGNLEISCRRGDIAVSLPEKASFQLTATTRRGDVNSDFGEVKVNNTDGTSTANGTVAKGGPRVTINSDTGDIRVTKLTTVAAK